MKLEQIVKYKIDGTEFNSIKDAKAHVDARIFKHIQKGTAYAGAGSEPSKMRLELMAYILENRVDIANLLSANFEVSNDFDEY